MKKVILCVLTCCCIAVQAQEEPEKKTPKAQYYRAGLGASAGMNNFSGIVGLTGEYQLARRFTINAGLGYSYWGTLASAGLRFYDNYPEGISFLLAYNRAFGLKDVNLSLKTAQDTVDASFRYDPASSLQLTLSYHWQTGKSSRFYVDAGYAIKLWDEPYEILSPENVRLSDHSRRLVEFRPPGGVVVGLGYIFGFGY